MEETLKNWIILILTAVALFFAASNQNKRDKIQYLENRCENLDTLNSEKAILIDSLQGCCMYLRDIHEDLNHCNWAYNELLEEYTNISDSLDMCRQKNFKFNPKVNKSNNGKSVKVNRQSN